jgi:hypothetical protein
VSTESEGVRGNQVIFCKKKIKEFQSKIVTLIVDVLTSKEDHMLASYQEKKEGKQC